jgi:hypothetical protein
MPGEPPARRHLFAGPEPATQDSARHHLLDLLLERARGAGFKVEGFGRNRHHWT